MVAKPMKGGTGKNDRKLTFTIKNKKQKQKKNVDMSKKDGYIRNKWGRFANKKEVGAIELKEILNTVTPLTPNDSTYDICIVITTFNREIMLKKLLDDIIKNSSDLKIIIGIFDDCSDKILDLTEYENRLNIVYNRYSKNHGKKQYWKLISDTMNFCKNINSKYFIYLPDDVRLIDDFFNKAITKFNNISDNKKICLNLLIANSTKTTKFANWTGFEIVELEDVYKTQFNDLCFIAERNFFEALEFRIDAINPNLWEIDKNAGSGVGSNISKRLHNMGYSMFHVKKTLVIHGEHDSQMNYSFRKVQKIIAMNKIAVCIPIYKRHEISDFVLGHYNQLRNELKDKIELILLCCGSEGEESKKIAEKNGFIYYEYPNTPLSQKQNFLYQKAKLFNPDACIKIDSDSILSVEFFYHYDYLINNDYDYGGISDIYFLTKKYLCYWAGYETDRVGEPTGVGRFMSKKLLDLLDWKPWGSLEINSRLDKNLTKNIQSIQNFNLKELNVSCFDVNGVCIDLKSDFGISDINSFKFSNIIDIENNEIYGLDFTKIINYLIDYNPKI